MSENHSSEQVLEVSGAQNNNFLDPNPDRAIRAPEEANGYDHDRVNQEPALLPVMGRAENDNDNGVSEEEEGGDFVDCSDELVSSAEKETAVVAVVRGELDDYRVRGVENGVLDGYVMDEQPEQQQQQQQQRRLSNAREYKDEREAFAREVAELRHGLKALINHQQPLLGENESGENDNSPLLEMIKECSLFAKLASEERLQAEATMREIRGVVLTKEQEIGDLNARVSELSVSNDAAASYMSSVQNSLEVSVEKDRHVEDVANRMLASLASVGYQEESLEDSISGKIIQVEKGNSLLIEKYNQILSEIDQLRQCLNETGVDIRVQEGHGTICVAARDELLELKRKEENLIDKVRHLEDENRKLVEQLDGHKEMVEKVNAELANTKIEVEQEKVRCANTKEKLTMAVTKGKALVQQRDSLKHSLADKTSELEKCLIELQEKSSALESAELSKEKVVKSENLIASLQETISERTSVLEKIDEIMSEAGVPEELLSMDVRERLRWLVDERNVLKGVSLESQKLKDAFSSFDLPETVSSSDLEAQVGWLRESFYRAQDDVNSLQDEIAKTREAGHNEIDRLSASLSTALQEKDYLETELADLMRKYEEIVEKEHQVTLEKDHLSASLSTALQEKDYLQTELAELMSKYEEIVVKERQVTLEKDHLSASLSAELQEKDYFQTELANLMGKYKEIVEKEHQVSVEKDQIVKMLIEVSGTEMENEEGVYQTFSDNSILVHRCFEKIKEQSSAPLDSSYVNAESFERVQSLLYVRDHELMLCEKLLEEEMMVRSEEEKLLNELKLVSEELVALKEEKSSLWKDLERSEEKSALVDKLSNELKLVSEELVALKEENSSLQRDLERLEEKSALVEKLSNELKLVSEELVALKEEKSSLQNDLERLEEKSTLVEKLSNELKSVSEELVALKEEKSSLQKDLERLEEKSALVEKLSNELKLVSEELVELKEEKSSLWKDLERSEEKSALVDKFSNELKLVSEELVVLKEEKSSLQKDLERLEEKSTLVEKVSNELKLVSEELVALKEEKSSLQKDLERSEEKSALVREKLSMAVKKGKGLVQDRENLKNLLDEKNSEIQKLKLELQQQESTVADCRDQIKTLSTDVEHIPKLEADLAVMKDQRDQLEQFLLESNKILQKVVESIDGIVLPVDTVFDEPVGKVNWLSGYINECLEAKTHAEQELGKVKEDASTLVSELAEAQATVKSLEDALSVVENNVTLLAEEKRELEVGKTNIEQELQKAVEEACSQTSKFVEACATRKSLEEALSLAENNISVLFREKEEAQVSKTAAEMDLEKVKEEVAVQTSKLTEAFKTIKSLEDSLSLVETNVALLTEQNNDAQVGRTNLENELKKLQEEAGSQANKLTDSYATIKSLEDALLRAEDDISVLQGEKKNAEKELLSLNSKLNACMEELAGTSGSFESKSIELAGHLNDLQVIMKDETLLSRVKECFEKKFESLRKMDLILKNIRTHFVEVDLEELQSHHVMEDDLNVMNSFSDSLNNIVDVEIDNSWVSAADGDNISSHFRKTVEGFQLRNKIIYDKVESFSSFIDECIAGLLRKLQETQDGVVFVLEHIESLKQKSKNLEMIQQEQETTIAMLENDVVTLLSACTDATRELQIEVKNNLLELISVPELEKLNHTLSIEMRETDGDATVEQQQRLDGNKHVDAADKLLLATRKFQSLVKQFESTSNVAADTVEELQNKLKQSRTSLENAIEERDLNQDRVSKLESEVEELQTSCSELRLKLNDSHSKEDKLKEREAEISSLSNTLLMKEKEAEDSLLSASQVKSLLDKVGGIEIPMAESEVGDQVPHNSAHVKKLFYIIDTVTELQQQVRLFSHDKEELQSTITTQILEIEHLKEEVEKLVRDRQDSEKVKDELSELTFGLEKIIGILGGELFDQKSAGVKGLLSVLEKQVVTMPLELENSKSKAQELGTKLLASQKVVDELSIKVKVLEDSLQDRSAQTEIVQERSIFEAPSLPTGSEISEIEDAGSLGQTTKSPVPPATVARTVRKGSAEHLAINVDVESERLINNEGSDEDKGHVFKSLNTSGLIPKQGKLIADRVDGIWVSGGRLLMSHPQARLGLIAYSLLLHIWLLATIL